MAWSAHLYYHSLGSVFRCAFHIADLMINLARLYYANLQFFSRYSYIWKFPKEQELAYSRFVQPTNLLSLRLVTFITLFGITIFLLIDYFRDVDFSVVLVTRIFVLSVASILMAVTFKKSLNPNLVPWGIVMIGFINFGAALITATYARMPAFYLTNLLFLILVLVVTASGLNLRHALLLNILLLTVFICYSQLVKKEPFYVSQYPHLFTSFIYFHIVGVVLEYRRRKSFLQFNDLDDQKRLIEDLNQQKNKIISILSHDVASPLNSLSGLLQLQASGQIKDEELKPFLNNVGSQLNNVSTLLHSLVRWSRSQIDGFVPEKKNVSVVKLLEENIALFQLNVRDKSLILKLNAQPLYVYADEEMIRIAIRNIVSNAIKFAHKGTEVEIECFPNATNKVIVQVTNHGDPIPDILREKLFTYQMPSAEGTAGERGTGLGLAIAAYFVQFNEGNIFLASSENKKITRFCIELPATSLSVTDQIDRVTSNFSK